MIQRKHLISLLEWMTAGLMFPFKKLAVIFLIINVLFTIYLYWNINQYCSDNQSEENGIWTGHVRDADNKLASLLTLGIIDFESSALHPGIHDLEGTIDHLCRLFHQVRIVVFLEKPIYPPLNTSKITCPSSVRFRIDFPH